MGDSQWAVGLMISQTVLLFQASGNGPELEDFQLARREIGQ